MKQKLWIPTGNEDRDELLEIRSAFFKQIQQLQSLRKELEEYLPLLKTKENTLEFKRAIKECKDSIEKADKSINELQWIITGINYKLEIGDYS